MTSFLEINGGLFLVIIMGALKVSILAHKNLLYVSHSHRELSLLLKATNIRYWAILNTSLLQDMYYISQRAVGSGGP